MSIKTALGAALAAAALAAAATAPAGANVRVGASGWQWGNPLPQGNTVRAMSFAGTTGYAAGDFGTLLKTTDGGTTWSGLPVGTFESLTVVQALDASTVLAGGGCVARRSVDGGRSFTAVRFTPVETSCRVALHDLSFVSADIGYLLLDDGSVYATTDGGAHFALRTAVPGTRAAGSFRQPGGIVFVSPRTGFVSGGGTVFQTLDGGVSWRAVHTDTEQLEGLWFADAQHGFAVGRGGYVLRTDDGGATWIPRTTVPGSPTLTSIRCNTSRVCVLTTETGHALIRVTNGDEAEPTVAAASTDPIYAAAFASPTRVVAGGDHGTTVVSDNTGVTFAPASGRTAGTFTALRAGGMSGTAYASGADGAIARTTDGGRSWSTAASVPTTADLRDVAFPNASDGYALDADGGLFHTTDAGATWASLGTGSTRPARAVIAPDASTVLVVGPRGLRRSIDAGRTFDQVRTRAVRRAPLRGASVARSGQLLVWGPRALARSADGGASWVALKRPRHVRIVQASFASARVGLLCDTAGRVWRTTSAGRRWTLLTSVGTQEVTGVAVDSTRSATLVLDKFADHPGGYLLRSDDAGATWQPQFVVDQPIGGRGLVPGGDVDYLLAGDASLLFSTTGGVAGDPSRLTVTTRHRRLRRPRRITVTGRLEPAAGGAQVTVSALRPGGHGWLHQTVHVAANGTFASAWRLGRGRTVFVAQWTGDFRSAGAGSRPLTVTVRPRRAHRRRTRRR